MMKTLPLVPGLMQLPVCLALMRIGFQFEDLKSFVMFVYAFHYIMVGLKKFLSLGLKTFFPTFVMNLPKTVSKDCLWFCLKLAI